MPSFAVDRNASWESGREAGLDEFDLYMHQPFFLKKLVKTQTSNLNISAGSIQFFGFSIRVSFSEFPPKYLNCKGGRHANLCWWMRLLAFFLSQWCEVPIGGK